MNATFAGFLLFVRNQAGISTDVLPDDSVYLTWAYNVAIETVNLVLLNASPTIYALAVYNLATSNLLNFAQDTPPSTFFADERKKFGIYGNVLGPLTSASDEGTSVSVQVPDFVKDLSISDVQLLKDPFGQRYLGFAQKCGQVWGLN